MGKIGKLTFWFLLVIGLKTCKSSVFHINKNSTVYSNNTSSGIFSSNETAAFVETFQNDSANNLIVWTEAPQHHKVKRSILLYKQKTLKIQVPDAPLFISSGQEGSRGEHGMPISVMLKSPEHSLKTLPYLIKAIKESTQHANDGDPQEPHGNHQHGMNPPEQHQNGPAKHHSQHTLNSEVHAEFKAVASETESGGPEAAKTKNGEPFHHPKHPSGPEEGRFPTNPEEPPHSHNGRFPSYPEDPAHGHNNEPVPGHHYPMYPPHNAQEVHSPLEQTPDDHLQHSGLSGRVGPERIPPGGEAALNPGGNHWRGGGGPKEIDSIKKETSNIISKKIVEDKVAVPPKQNLEKRDGSKNLVTEPLEEPKLDSIQDLANGAMNFQSIKFVKNSWILPPVDKRNHPPNLENGDYRHNNGLPGPPHSKSFNNPAYEAKASDPRNRPISDLNHGPGDKYMLTGTEEPEMSFDDKGNLLFLKKQTLEILVPKFLMNYTQDGATTVQPPENYPTGNLANKLSRVNMKYFTQNERDKEYYIQRYMNKRRANRDIKATFWHNRGLEDKLIAKTEKQPAPKEKKR